MSALDVIYLIIGLPVLILALFLGFTVTSAITATATSLANATSPGQNTTIMAQTQSALTMFDSAFLFIILGFGVITIIGASMINTHPVFAIASILLFFFITLLSSVVTDMYAQLADSAAMAGVSNNFPTINFIMEHLPMLMLALSIILAIVMYGRSNSNYMGG